MRWAALALSPLLLLAGCTAPAPVEPTRNSPSPTSNVVATPSPAAEVAPVVVQAVQPRPPTSGSAPLALASPVALPLSVLAGRSGADLRVTLDRLLQEQVFLTAITMNAASNARVDELIGASTALDQSSITLAEVVGAVKGPAAAHAILDAWRGQAADLVQYAGGRQTSATADLDQRRPAIAAQLASGDFSVAMVDELLRTRNQTQLALADAILAHDPIQLSQRLRAAARASDDLGRPLAAGLSSLVPTQAPPPTEGLDIDVRLELNELWQAEVWLTGAALDAAADGRTSELDALRTVVDANATEIGQQVGAVWGVELGNGLSERMRAESAALISAASGGDRRQAATDLDRVRGEIDGLLSAANPLLPKGLLGQELRASDQPLLTAGDALVGRDFAIAYTRLRESAHQIQKPADALALSIVDRFPGRYLVLPTPVPDASPTPVPPPQ